MHNQFLAPSVMLCASIVLTSQVSAFTRSTVGDAAASISRLDPWSRTEVALSGGFQRSARSVPRSTADFLAALERNRPYAVAKAGGLKPYSAQMSLYEAKTFKGYSYEESLVRRWNSRPQGPRFRLSERGHQYVDIERFDPNTGQSVQKLQAYGGDSPRAALDKLLISDSAADKLIVTSDVFDRIQTEVGEVEAIWGKIESGAIDETVGLRLIRQRAQKIGLEFDESTSRLSMHHRGQSAVLGQLGTPELQKQLGRLVRDRITSRQVALNQFHAMLSSDPNLSALWSRLGGTDAATQAMKAMYDLQQQQVSKGGIRPGAAGRLATDLQRQASAAMLEESDYSLRRAALSGVPNETITKVLSDVNESVRQGVSPAEALGRANEELGRAADKSRRIRTLKGQSILLAFTVVGATVDYALSEQELSEWIRSDRPVEWVARTGVGAVAVTSASTLERVVLENAIKHGGAEAAERVGSRLASRLVGGGVAAAVFIVGESTIAALFHDASWGEVADAALEAAVVIAVAEGAVLGAELLIYGEIGSIGGPAGFAIAMGAGLAYEGVKYMWTSRRDLEADHNVYVTKCSVARDKVRQWCEATCDVMVTAPVQ